MIAVVGALAIGGTIAFYNDTETSTGNIFTAGSVDLKVDHLKQTYNGVDCKTCAVDILSDITNIVVATTNGSDPVAFPHAAVVVTPTSVTTAGTNWDANIPGADWIWATDPVLLADVQTNVTYTFEKTFTWWGAFTGASVDFAVASDNSYEVWLNGTKIAEDTSENNHSTADVIAVDLTPNIVQGTNTLQFVVKNWAQPTGTVLSNPAGLKYALHIDGNCGDAYFQNQCHLWTETDLTDQTFFDFNDIKPADWGTNVISLHVYDNDAYACLIVSEKDDQENTLLETETEDGDALNVGNPLGDGELSNYINVFTWGDTNGNGVYETGEDALGNGSLFDLSSIMSLDTLNQQFLTATTTKNIGLAWCAGTLTPNIDGTFTCDGAGMPNKAQSDSFSANLTAYAEQTRNNEEFDCEDVVLPPTEG